jgi:hypothetical protein
MGEQDAYDELSIYTLSLGDPSFIHQLVVDAFAAQNADANSKSIFVAYSLAGLYLHHEHRYTGREVQKAHVDLTAKKNGLPFFDLPKFRGELRVTDALTAKPGPERDRMIERWSFETWQALNGLRDQIHAWLIRDLRDFDIKAHKKN